MEWIWTKKDEREYKKWLRDKIGLRPLVSKKKVKKKKVKKK